MKRLAAVLAIFALAGTGAALATTTSHRTGTDVLCQIPTNTPPPAQLTPDAIRGLCNLPSATR